MFNQVTIIGVGLIGGSFALALDAVQAVKKVVGVGRSREAMQRALQLGVIDEIAANEAEAVRHADLVLLAAPVAQTETILRAIAPHLGLRTIVTDAGSTKGDVVAAARRALGGKFPQFVPAHPIAGKEQSGVDAAEAGLYHQRRCIVTPVSETAGHALETVVEAWKLCGALVSEMTPEQHDQVFAAVSHLPHLLSFALVAAIAKEPDAAQKFAHAGGGFRDFTRIAASSPEMWRDICFANRAALLQELDAYEAELKLLRDYLNRNEVQALEQEFAQAREIRSALRF
jgi:prephenate dehydrogenase